MIGKEYDMALDALRLAKWFRLAVLGVVIFGGICGLVNCAVEDGIDKSPESGV